MLLKKGDFLIILVVLILAFLWLFTAKAGDSAAIYVDGELYERVSLSKDNKIEVKSKYGENTVVIKDGKVSITNSDCPGKDCEKGEISETSRSLVCLPNRLTVIIEGDKAKNETDVVL